MTTTQRKSEYLNDPTDSYVEVKEYTEEEVFYAIENPTHDDYERYYTSLERKLKSVKDEVKFLHDTAKGIDGASFWENKLQKILLKFNTY